MGPGYWMNEIGGELRPAVIAYLERRLLTLQQIHLIRLYLAQWINDDAWAPTLALLTLQKSVAEISTRQDIDKWLSAAEEEGIDPL